MGWYETLAERRGRQWVSIGRALPLNSCLVCCLNHLSKIQISLARTVLPLYSHIRAHIRTYKHPRTLASIYSLRQMMFTGVSFSSDASKKWKKKNKKQKPFHFTLPKWETPLPLLFEHVQKTTYKNKIQ